MTLRRLLSAAALVLVAGSAWAQFPDALDPFNKGVTCTGACSTIRGSLVGYWKLEEASGTRADSTSNANNLTDNNTVTQASGIVGQAASFASASSEYLSIADTASLSMSSTQSFTIAAWFKSTTTSGNHVLVSKGNLSGPYTGGEYSLETSGNKLGLHVGDGGSNTASAATTQTFSTNTWTFVVAYYDKTNGLISTSLNNGTLNSSLYSSGSYDSTFQFVIGRWANFNGGYFDGAIDEVGIWKRVLTASEITYLYNSGAGRTLY